MAESNLDIQIAATDDAIVTRWVVVAETLNPDGSESFRMCRSPGLSAWTAGGMLRFGADLDRPVGYHYEPVDDEE